MNKIKIFACHSAEKFTKEVCECLGLPIGEKDSFKFKNDNNFVQFKETVRDYDVYIIQTTEPPVNERIMELLITNAGRVYSRDDLLDIIWGAGYPKDARTVDVHVRRLREKIEKYVIEIGKGS